MHEKVFPTPAIEAKHRQGMLGQHFDYFLTWMQKHGYSRYSIHFRIQCITHFGKYLKERGINSIHQLEGAQGQKLLAAYRKYCQDQGHWHRDSRLKLYIQALEEAGILRSLPPKDSSLYPETKQYSNFLKNQKGLSDGSIRHHLYWTEKFLHFLGYQKDTSSLPSFGIADIDRFMEEAAVSLQRATIQGLSGSLRGFLRFLYQSGKLATDLSCLLVSPRRYKLESLPRVLSWGEVKRIIESVDRSSRTGPQHYAILVLLANYGLRAGEVAHLKLRDINWRRKSIRITPRKSGKDLYLPLTSQVAQAITDYLKRGRPASKCRELLLLSCAPFKPLTSQNIAYVVNRHLQLAGLGLSVRGPHLIRHSFATHLMRKGVPLKYISDLMGHRSLASTHIYTKTATEHLREVALEVPEVG